MFTRISGNITVTAILIILSVVQARYRLSFSSQRICAVTGSTVKIPCEGTTRIYPSDTEYEWYRVQSPAGNLQILNDDPQYSRQWIVQRRGFIKAWWFNCELTIKDVKLSNSGVYNFGYKTQGRKLLKVSSGVNLTITDLQVKMDPNIEVQTKVKVTCSSTCRPNTDQLDYRWFKNGYQQHLNGASVVIDVTTSSNEGNYSCQVFGSRYRSPALCIRAAGIVKSSWSVTYSVHPTCTLVGTWVNIHSHYTYPNNQKIRKSVWFVGEQDSVDLREDEGYKERVQYLQNSRNNSTVRISHVRASDAQTYRFRFYTDDGDYTGQPGVTLSITDLEVSVWDLGSQKKLTCSTTCTLPNNPTYVWYKNGQPVTDQYRKELSLSERSENAGSYSCAVKGREELRSPAVCVFDENSCWSVTYPNTTICALIGSSVDIHSYYTSPVQQSIAQPAWHVTLLEEETELRHTDERVEVYSVRHDISTLRLKHVIVSDSAKYHLEFKDPYRKHVNGSAGVFLTVTDLQVKVEPVATSVDVQRITLYCSTTCTLPNDVVYIWYKNGQRVSDCKSSYCSVIPTSGGANYSCAIEGHESSLSLPVWPKSSTVFPLHVTVGLAVFLAVMLISGALWICKIKSRSALNKRNTGKWHQASNPSKRAALEDDDVQYAVVRFKPNHRQEGSPLQTVTLPLKDTEDLSIEYATVNFTRH